MAGLTPIAHPGFGGGLNLAVQPDAVAATEAIDLLDVTFTEEGAVRSRDGFGLLTGAPGTNRYDSLAFFQTTGGVNQLVCGAGNRLEALSSSGAPVASATTPTASPHFFARFGGPGAEVLYCANGTDSLRQWDGTAFSTPAWTGTSPTGRFVSVTPWDNRLVNARRAGSAAANSPSTVLFSDTADTGAPLNWSANNWVEVTPGDGEEIMGMVAWREYLFVFKESKFFVFYATITASDGTPEFSYRPVDTGIGLCAPRAVCAGNDAVYFLNRRGVYRTTGGPPELVSGKIDPFFLGGTSDFFRSNQWNTGAIEAAAMTWHREQVYLAVPTGGSVTNNRLLVFDTKRGWWSLWSIKAGALVSWAVQAQNELVFAYASGANHVGRCGPAFSNDAGSPIAARWLSGFFDYGDSEVKSLRELKLAGQGRVMAGVAVDYRSGAKSRHVDFGSGLDVWGDGTDPSDVWGDGTI